MNFIEVRFSKIDMNRPLSIATNHHLATTVIISSNIAINEIYKPYVFNNQQSFLLLQHNGA